MLRLPIPFLSFGYIGLIVLRIPRPSRTGKLGPGCSEQFVGNGVYDITYNRCCSSIRGGEVVRGVFPCNDKKRNVSAHTTIAASNECPLPHELGFAGDKGIEPPGAACYSAGQAQCKIWYYCRPW